MFYGQPWDLLYDLAHERHNAKIREAAQYRLMKRLQRQKVQPTNHGARMRWWRQPPFHEGGLTTTLR